MLSGPALIQVYRRMVSKSAQNRTTKTMELLPGPSSALLGLSGPLSAVSWVPLGALLGSLGRLLGDFLKKYVVLMISGAKLESNS